MNVVQSRQKGAVSLFVVIFSALLIIVTATAFIRIMVQDQMQATASDLSKSALDSANAGVEDAKRSIIRYVQECPLGASTNVDCGNWFSLMDGTHCETNQQILGMTGSGEIQVGDDADLNQAYTCVKVTLNTKEYVNSLSPGASRVVHLKADRPYDTVTIQWFSKNDLDRAPAVPIGIKRISLIDSPELERQNTWNPSTPSLMRAQLLQFGSSFTVNDFDSDDLVKNNTATVFMMPSTVGSETLEFTAGYASGSLQQVKCDQTFSSVGGKGSYGCKVDLKLPLPVGASSINDRKDAYLRLQAPYNSQTNFQITLSDSENSSTNVVFDGVQPRVDSTGRASDLFRRVVTRVESGGSFPYIEGTLDIAGDLCKTFTVGTKPTDYLQGTCRP